jgi:hypothetical protein
VFFNSLFNVLDHFHFLNLSFSALLFLLFFSSLLPLMAKLVLVARLVVVKAYCVQLFLLL